MWLDLLALTAVIVCGSVGAYTGWYLAKDWWRARTKGVRVARCRNEASE